MENKRKPKTLKNNSDFSYLKDHGFRVFPNDWLIINYKKNSVGASRVGWTVPKAVGNAVMRNKLKRWSREVLRNSAPSDLPREIDLNVIFRVKKDGFYKNLNFYDFQSAITGSCNKIQNKLEKHS